MFRSKKIDKKIASFIVSFKDKEMPLLPINAKTLIEKYSIPEGRKLGVVLKKIEEKWIDNDFELSEKEIQKTINN
jgi:poly(A) polymerase